MTVLDRPVVVAPTPSPTGAVVRAIARAEARRLLRHPLLYVGLGLCAAITAAMVTNPGDWHGAAYQSAPLDLAPLAVVTSMLVAASFHRERAGVAPEAPVAAEARAAGLLLGAGVMVLLTAVLAVAGGLAFRLTGGLDLGDEPGRTLHAHFTLPEILQPVFVTVLGIAVGAAAGRVFRQRAGATLVLFVAWFPLISIAWAFQARQVTPFSIVQIQPVSVPVGPITADPDTFPHDWLLSAPGQYQDHWARVFVSAQLGAGHDLWLLGLACCFTAVVLPRFRTRLLLVGAVVAALGVGWQYWVIP